LKFTAVCTITVPKYGLGTSRLFGMIKGNIKLPIDADDIVVAEVKARNALLENGVLKHEIYQVYILEPIKEEPVS
jgi:hypothetical protein